jgi:propanol-preferring alcohol dehydrogenase
MRRMLLEVPGAPLRMVDGAVPVPGRGQVLLRVRACAVCRTDLHIVDGELPNPKLPLVPGHEIIGTVAALADDVAMLNVGDRVGVPWLGWTCGECSYCRRGAENLCDRAKFTGYTCDGGYAEYALAEARYCLHIPDAYNDTEAAPLLCAGLIGYRCLVKAGTGQRLGIFGFGAAAHIVTQVAKYQGRDIYAFTRPGDEQAARFAASLGACWVGGSDQLPPAKLDAAIIFAPVGALVPQALRAVGRGGIVVCGGIHMSDIPQFPYALLWEERAVVSVANLTRRDGKEFLTLAPKVPVRTTVQRFPLEAANEALARLREGAVEGAAVLVNDGARTDGP